MLKNTKEYENFGNFVEDSGGNAIRVPAGKENIRANDAFPSGAADGVPEEEQAWVPQDAFSMAYQFRGQHGNDLSPELINQLLSNLNKIWQDREKKQI